MKQHLIPSRFGVRAEFKLYRGRKTLTEHLNGIEPVVIVEVSWTEAPVAYSISVGPGVRDRYAVRSHGGGLWWPLLEDMEPITTDRFLGLVADDWQKAALILDPMQNTYTYFGLTAEERFEGQPLQAYRSDYEKKLGSANLDASLVMIIGGRIHVSAGEPVWYAMPDRKGDTMDVRIGCTSLDQRNRERFHFPFLDRTARAMTASRGRAFGLDEIVHGLGWLSADQVRYRNEVIDTRIHRNGPAADLCVMAFAERLFYRAFESPDLLALVPALVDYLPDGRLPPPLSHQEVFRQFVSLRGTPFAASYPVLMDDAVTVFDRVCHFKRADLTDDQDDAVTSFAVSA